MNRGFLTNARKKDRRSFTSSCGSGNSKNGVGDGTRTRDILSHSQTLHQLSYTHHN